MNRQSVIVFEDAGWRGFYPLTLARAAFDLRAGATTLGRRLAAQLAPVSSRVGFLCRPLLRPLVERDYRGHAVNHPPEGETLFVNGRLLCLGSGFTVLQELLDRSLAVHVHQTLAAVRLPEESAAGFYRDLEHALHAGEPAPMPKGFSEVGPPEEVTLLRHPWEAVAITPKVVEDDFAWAKERPHPDQPVMTAGAQILGREHVIFREGVHLEPGSILDARTGPILLGEGVQIQHNAVILGPAAIGPRTRIKMGARLYDGVSLGPECRMGGEVEAVVAQGYANKQHDGFLGHAYLGAWTNLGAATNNSDLKNNYGPVRVWTPDGEMDTGERFVGAFLGDHAKTAIGTRLNTGTVIGFSSNVFVDGFPPKHVPSFTWGGGDPEAVYDLDRAIAAARTVMARRKVEMEPADEVVFRHIYENRTG